MLPSINTKNISDKITCFFKKKKEEGKEGGFRNKGYNRLSKPPKGYPL